MKLYTDHHAVPFQPPKHPWLETLRTLAILLLVTPFAVLLRLCDRAANYRGRSDA